jgi:hypothetical protein
MNEGHKRRGWIRRILQSLFTIRSPSKEWMDIYKKK